MSKKSNSFHKSGDDEQMDGQNTVQLDRRKVVGGVAGAAVAAATVSTSMAQDDPTGPGINLPQGLPQSEPLGAVIPDDVQAAASDWPTYQQNYASDRAARDSGISSENVESLELVWTHFADDDAGLKGPGTSPALVLGDSVYYQDPDSNIFKLSRETGETIWMTPIGESSGGPSGIAVAYGRVIAHTTTDLYAVDTETGDLLWRNTLVVNDREGFSGTPVVYDSVIYMGKSPGAYAPGNRGSFMAVDAGTGTLLWEFDTTNNLWGAPALNSGGGVWYPASIDADGNLYFGTGNAGPVPGVGGAGRSLDIPDLYSSCMVSLDRETGSVRWHYQDKPHDILDLDFQSTPILTEIELDGETREIAIGSGKTGNVVAVDRHSGELLWRTPVGMHNEYGDGLAEIPEEPVVVLPGPAGGGVQTNLAYSEGTVFVPVNNSASLMSATEWAGTVPHDQATGELVAINVVDGSIKWKVDHPSLTIGSATVANDVVFTGSLDGRFMGYHVETGELLWSHQFGSGIYTPPSIAGDMLFVIASGPFVPPANPGGTPDAMEPVATPIEPAAEATAEKAEADEMLSKVLAVFRLPS